MPDTLLQVDDVSVRYGAIEAVRGISFDVAEGEAVTLIGGNGAGKTTTLRTISGVHRPAGGTISFGGRRIDDVHAHRIVELGISHTPEGRKIFPRMTVRENLDMGAYARRNHAEVQSDLDRVFTRFPRLKERERQPGGTLSGGEQQMLAIGRSLMARPRLLMLDEPSMGLAPLVVATIFDLLAEIHREGMTLLLVEQNAQMALGLCDRGYVLESGAIVLRDSAGALLGNDAVRKAYLGEI
jgi:branched-chain amino acid transport system ATP-binding protein